MFTIEPKVKPKWYQLRKQLALFLVFSARKVEPNSDYTNAYLLEQFTKAQMDALAFGKGAIRVEHVPYGELTK